MKIMKQITELYSLFVGVDCGTLSPPEFGTLDLDPDTRFDSVATYSCFNGYDLIGGDATRMCQADGVWTGSQPTCRRELIK